MSPLATQKIQMPFHGQPNAFFEDSINYLHWDAPKSAPVIHWAHANGFSGGTYAPLLSRLTDLAHIYAWDARGHGATKLSANPKELKSWSPYKDDMIRFVEKLADRHGQKIYLTGHSLGATTSILAAAERPDLVEGLLLVDPVIIPYHLGWLSGFLHQLKLPHPVGHLIRRSSRRRRVFKSRSEIAQSYYGRGAFTKDDEGFLNAYLESAIEPKEGGVGLCCQPEWEAQNYIAQRHNSARAIKALTCNVVLVQAEKGSTVYSNKPFLKTRKPVTFRTIEDTTHFLPFEKPDAVASHIAAMISGEPA
ncbi:MAG TPA: alpha/beta hydrolase [Rhodobiaceae bacterium]|nr:alpha/beta hydrolase [Rhodobiaceae bacterium]